MSVTSPALDTWHRKLVGEASNRCLKALAIYEEMPCYCYLGNPPHVRDPCVEGHCPNIDDMPRAVLDVVIAYANRRAEMSDIQSVERDRLCYSGPNWIKDLIFLASNPPHSILAIPSPFKRLDQDVLRFLERYI